jgi:polysaccharide pyruvyl transferase WcaK-like protein
MMTHDQKQVAIFGAAQDTGNLGVSALSQSIVIGLWSRGLRNAVVFDHGRGIREQTREVGAERISFRAQGAVGGLRLYRPENLARAVVESRIGLTFNPILRTILNASAVLDISGGDSFSDIYGKRRFTSVTQPKQLALGAGTPLVLMPQTYGPFQDADRRAEASDILRRSRLAFARDERSYRVMRELLGNHFDPAKHMCGVDVAFGLPVSEPSTPERDAFLAWKDRQAGRIAGFNVSGLLFNAPSEAMKQFGLRTDFQSLALAFATRLLRDTNASLLLMPHVLDRQGSQESDEVAVRAVRDALQARFGARVFVPAVPDSAPEAKWFISHCDWFTGARMHATIAALSSGVPALALAYSGKMHGVFESCGQGHNVVDLRTMRDERAVIDAMFASLEEANTNRQRLALALPQTLAKAKHQFDCIARQIECPQRPMASNVVQLRTSDAA